MKLIDAGSVTGALNWQTLEKISPYPPLAANIGGTVYRLTGFCSGAEKLLYAGEMSLSEVFELASDVHGEPDFVELGRMVNLAEKLGESCKSVDFLKSRVKGRKNIQALKILTGAPETFLSYISKKTPSMKTVGLYAALPDAHKEFLHSFASARPSVSAFRSACEILTDYADREIDLSDKELLRNLCSGKNSVKDDFISKFHDLASAAGVQAASENGFETSRIIFSFTADSYESYAESAEDLFKKKEAVRELFEFLKDNDIY